MRDPTGPRARSVAAAGAELVVGDLHDPLWLRRAAEGARAVFSVQMPALTADGFDFAGEVTQGTHLVEAARAVGVPQFVHTSVTGAGQHTRTTGWADGPWSATMGPTPDAEAAVQDRVREAGFAHRTLLKPGSSMENFLPGAAFLLPRGIGGGLVSVIEPAIRSSLVDVRDIGAAAVAAPERFDGVELELASDHLSTTDIADTLSRAIGVPLTAPDMTEEQALAAGMPPPAASHAG